MDKGTGLGRPLSTNPIQGTFRKSLQRGSEPKDEQIRISYGVIAEVNEDNSTVRVDVFSRGGNRVRIGASPERGEGAFLAVLQSITVIHHLYGSLRKGLVVRVYWRGKHIPGNESVVEVISDAGEETFGIGIKKTRSNELATMPHEIFTGGVSS